MTYVQKALSAEADAAQDLPPGAAAAPDVDAERRVAGGLDGRAAGPGNLRVVETGAGESEAAQ